MAINDKCDKSVSEARRGAQVIHMFTAKPIFGVERTSWLAVPELAQRTVRA